MSKISRNKLFILGIICGLIMCISGIYAFTNTSVLKIKNELNTGGVNIDLKEYTIKDGQELIYTDIEKIVLPGQIISLIPRISNLGDSSYVRVKLTYVSLEDSLISISDDNVDGMAENWVKKGEYWYYRDVVNPGEDVDVFQTLRIPIDVPNEFQGQAVQLNISAEAVQAKNFTPDFNSDAPWRDIDVREANTTYEADMIQINPNAVVEYENNANLYLDVPDNFFYKLGHILPGDVYEDEITVKNTGNLDTEYFVSTDKFDNLSDKSIEILEKLQLKIISDTGIIYEGNAYKLENCSLGVYKKDTQSNLKFIISVPSELGNEYANLSSGIKWEFSILEKEKKPEPEPEPEEPSPQTGDIKIRIAIITFIISAIGLIVVLFLERKTKR